MGITVHSHATLHVDNQPSILISTQDTHHGRSKHIDIAHLKTREYVNDGVIKMEWISTTNNVADIFTKALPPISFNRHRDKLK